MKFLHTVLVLHKEHSRFYQQAFDRHGDTKLGSVNLSNKETKNFQEISYNLVIEMGIQPIPCTRKADCIASPLSFSIHF